MVFYLKLTAHKARCVPAQLSLSQGVATCWEGLNYCHFLPQMELLTYFGGRWIRFSGKSAGRGWLRKIMLMWNKTKIILHPKIKTSKLNPDL